MTMTDTPDSTPETQERVREGLAAAEALCAKRKVQFTPARRCALEALLSQTQALGAYEVLDRMREAGLGSQPPAAYRALDFLVAQGLAHRIERLNAYVACSHSACDHFPAFFICSSCDTVSETPSRPSVDTLNKAAEEAGFEIDHVLVEARGICGACKEAANA